MEIQVDKNTKIVGTKICWEIQKYRPPYKNKPEGEWVPFKWFNSLGSAAAWLAHREIRLSEGSTIADLQKAVEQVHARWSSLIDGFPEHKEPTR